MSEQDDDERRRQAAEMARAGRERCDRLTWLGFEVTDLGREGTLLGEWLSENDVVNAGLQRRCVVWQQALDQRLKDYSELLQTIRCEVEHRRKVHYDSYFSPSETATHRHYVRITGWNEYDHAGGSTIWCVEADFDVDLLREWVVANTEIVGHYEAENDDEWVPDGWIHEFERPWLLSLED